MKRPALVGKGCPMFSLFPGPCLSFCVVGSIPAGGALEAWPWTSVLNRLVDSYIRWATRVFSCQFHILFRSRMDLHVWNPIRNKNNHDFCLVHRSHSPASSNNSDAVSCRFKQRGRRRARAAAAPSSVHAPCRRIEPGANYDVNGC